MHQALGTLHTLFLLWSSTAVLHLKRSRINFSTSYRHWLKVHKSFPKFHWISPPYLTWHRIEGLPSREWSKLRKPGGLSTTTFITLAIILSGSGAQLNFNHTLTVMFTHQIWLKKRSKKVWLFARGVWWHWGRKVQIPSQRSIKCKKLPENDQQGQTGGVSQGRFGKKPIFTSFWGFVHDFCLEGNIDQYCPKGWYLLIQYTVFPDP